MRILLTNDDGILSPGIRALAEGFRAGNEVFMIAPDSERSGASHSFTFMSPLRAMEVKLAGLEDIPSYAVSGTPVDCVKLGCGNICLKPDIVISGINLGANLGTDVLYSGTASAAMEGLLLGVPSIAVSLSSLIPEHYETAVAATKALLPMLAKSGAEMLNINVPDLPTDQIKGVKVTQLSRLEYAICYHERIDPRNLKYYWCPVERIKTDTEGMDNDDRWMREGYVSVTPLKPDLTDRRVLEKLSGLADGMSIG